MTEPAPISRPEPPDLSAAHQPEVQETEGDVSKPPGLCIDTAYPDREPDMIEDAAFVSPDSCSAGVFDGIGSGGDKSGLVAFLLKNSMDEILGDFAPTESVEKIQEKVNQKLFLLRDRIQSTYSMQWVRDHGEQVRGKIGTTASVVYIRTDTDGKQEAVIGQLGDSRVYRLDGRDLMQLTQDDSNAILIGLMSADYTPNEAMLKAEEVKFLLDEIKDSRYLMAFDDDPKFKEAVITAFNRRNVVTKSFFPLLDDDDGKNQMTFSTHPVKVGDRILICSDGIHDNLTGSEITAVMADTSLGNQQAAAKLVALAIERAKTTGTDHEHFRAKLDDCTAVVLTVQPPSLTPHTSEPSEPDVERSPTAPETSAEEEQAGREAEPAKDGLETESTETLIYMARAELDTNYQTIMDKISAIKAARPFNALSIDKLKECFQVIIDNYDRLRNLMEIAEQNNITMFSDAVDDTAAPEETSEEHV